MTLKLYSENWYMRWLPLVSGKWQSMAQTIIKNWSCKMTPRGQDTNQYGHDEIRVFNWTLHRNCIRILCRITHTVSIWKMAVNGTKYHKNLQILETKTILPCRAKKTTYLNEYKKVKGVQSIWKSPLLSKKSPTFCYCWNGLLNHMNLWNNKIVMIKERIMKHNQSLQ
jgi:hypothetical protein